MDFLLNNWHTVLTAILGVAAFFGFAGKFKADRLLKALKESGEVWVALEKAVATYGEAIKDGIVDSSEKDKLNAAFKAVGEEATQAFDALKKLFGK